MIKKRIKMIILKYYINRCHQLMCKNKKLKGKYQVFHFIANNSLTEFKKLKCYNDETNLESVRKKNKIRFGFVVYTSSMWNVDELYHLLTKNEHFDTSIIVAHFNMTDKESSDKEYNKTIEYFKKLNYRIIEAGIILPGECFDILFYLTPFDFYDEIINLNNISLDTIILHTSYSYMLAGNMQKLDLPMYHWTLRYYTDSEYYKKLVENNKYYTGNARYLGFPKMDEYYTAEQFRPSNKKVIIYAPHHSVNYTKFKSATFEDNYKAILELAKKYSDETYWIYKPHPLLRDNSVLGGIFKTGEEYDEYENQWAELENAEVITGGEYFSVFKGSSAMITDSISFLAEYQFTGNPLLLLESGQETYNDFGNDIIKILYRCSGKDVLEIEKFVKNIIEGKDPMCQLRNKFFKNNLFYMSEGLSANERIYKDIINFTDKG